MPHTDTLGALTGKKKRGFTQNLSSFFTTELTEPTEKKYDFNPEVLNAGSATAWRGEVTLLA
jgi:hypothetical protein